MDTIPSPLRQAPQEWIDALERGRADVEAKRTIDAAELLGRLEREDSEAASGHTPAKHGTSDQ